MNNKHLFRGSAEKRMRALQLMVEQKRKDDRTNAFIKYGDVINEMRKQEPKRSNRVAWERWRDEVIRFAGQVEQESNISQFEFADLVFHQELEQVSCCQ